MMYWLNIWSNY